MSLATQAGGGLGAFELPRPAVEPALRALRLWNILLDALFYDVCVLTMELAWRGELVTTQTARHARPPAPIRGPGFKTLDLGALSDPEGCILVVDAARAPFVTRFDRVDEFKTWATGEGADVAIVTITGVGSSAFGSAAFAWNVSTALGRRVAAIVPGYGVADAWNQALGGWFGFGLRDWLGALSLSQQALARTAPITARIGHRLLASIPGRAVPDDGAPVFRTGSGASDVLHALLDQVPGLTTLIGHSKGALAIGNALRSLDPVITRRLSVATFGCPIDESIPVARYQQFLGALDALGALNAWGHAAAHRPITTHSTNTTIPLSMPIAILTRLALAAPPALPPGPPALPPPKPPALLAAPIALPSRPPRAGARAARSPKRSP
jgi:hypothetical protein